MAKASGIRAGRAFVELFADDSKLVQGLRNASEKLDKWGKSVGAAGKKMLMAGGAATGSLIGAAVAFSNFGDALDKMAGRTGISVESLSELGFAADLSGTSMEAVENAVRIMQRNLVGGSKGVEDALAGMGLSLQELAQQSPEQQFMTLGDAISRIEDPTAKAAAAMTLFGRSGTELLPMFADGAAGVEAMRQQARDLGQVMSTEDATAAAALNDSLGMLTGSVKRAFVAVGAALAPALTDLADKITAAMPQVMDFIEKNRGLIVVALEIAAGVTAAGAAFIGLGAGLRVASVLLAGLASTAGLIGTALTAMVSPAGLILGSLLGIGAAALYITGAWDSAIGFLGDSLEWLKGIASQTFKGISDALAAGDLGLAAEIAMEGVKIVWFTGMGRVKETFFSVTNAIAAAWTNLQYDLAGLILFGVGKIQNTWFDLQGVLKKAWVKTTTFLGDMWDALYYRLARAFTNLTHLFSSASDAAAAREALSQEEAARAKERHAKAEQQLGEIERERVSRDQALQSQMDTLEEDRARALAGIKPPKIKEFDKAAEAQRKLGELAAKAAEARQKAEQEAAKGPAKPKAPPAPAAPEVTVPEMPEVGAATQAAEVRSSVVGTFSGLAAAGLGTGSPIERTARASEETAKNTKKLLQAVQDTGLMFV